METKLRKEILEASTLEEAAALLGEDIGLRRPASLDQTRRALEDPQFARALLSTRKLPHVRDQLLAAAGQSATSLASQAVDGVLKWGMEGLRPAEPWVISRRLAACKICEYHTDAPESLLFRGARVLVGKDKKICALCNCLTNTKAAISTEHCPAQDPKSPEQSRWAEPWVPLDEHPKGPW